MLNKKNLFPIKFRISSGILFVFLRLIGVKCEEKNGLFIQTVGRLCMTTILKMSV